MILESHRNTTTVRWVWWLAFGALALYVAARMGALSLWADVATPDGLLPLPNTFASVDHPFHVARAEMLWRELASGRILRWVGQHQGGYPVEFYPLGEAWLEVAVRALSLDSLAPQGAHTLAVIALFLLPGIAFAVLASIDGWSPAVGLIALALHVSLPGGWYHGGYTELVQWGLVTNVAAAVASFLMLPALIRFLKTGGGVAGAAAASVAAAAVYCNPRSLLGLTALGAAGWLTIVLIRDGLSAGRVRSTTIRLIVVTGLATLLAAPELLALARFGGLYEFVRYSGYEEVADFVSATVGAVSWPVAAFGLAGLGLGLIARRQLATTSTAIALILYVLLTATIAFVPVASRLAPQLEPTRLMPLQRLLTFYLAAVAACALLDWLLAKVANRHGWVSPTAAVALAAAIVLTLTRPLPGPPPDPAYPSIVEVSLYPVAMSAQPEQLALEAAVAAADRAARPGTALLVLGSALSWHQQLWVPLWTERPLFYDNWLWYWHPRHAGTPGYAFQTGHHFPDPERTLERSYLARHGIGGVVVTGAARTAAARSPLLTPVRSGIFDAYAVLDPVTTVTFGADDDARVIQGNQRISAIAGVPGQPVVARVNWHPRWNGSIDGREASAARREDGYIAVASAEPVQSVELIYVVQPLDWLGRLLAGAGGLGVLWLAGSGVVRGTNMSHWYAHIQTGWRFRARARARKGKGERWQRDPQHDTA